MKKEIFIIGGGESLKGFDFNLLKDKTTMVINKAIFYLKNANFFITHDLAFFKKIDINAFIKIKIPKFFVISSIVFPYMEIIKERLFDRRFQNTFYDLKMLDSIIISKKEKGIGITLDDFRHGHCSGYSALQLAIIMGYTEINLLGFDLLVGENTHWHNGYNLNDGDSKEENQERFDYYYFNFKTGLNEIVKKVPNIKIYNYSKNGRLNDIIPYKSLKEI